jgi:hypothetical protein
MTLPKQQNQSELENGNIEEYSYKMEHKKRAERML